MKVSNQTSLTARKYNEPLFASTWVALYVSLRLGLTQALNNR